MILCLHVKEQVQMAKFVHQGEVKSQNPQILRFFNLAKLARACGVPAVGIRAVDCWQ